MVDNTREAFGLGSVDRRTRRQPRVSSEEPKPLLNIDDTSYYNRPITAAREDIPVRENEDNSVTYLDVRGREYTVYPTQPVARPEGGYARAAGRAISDAVSNVGGIGQTLFSDLPRAIQSAGPAARQALSTFTEQPRGPAAILSGTRPATMGDVADVSGTAVLGSIPFRVPDGSLRIFGGRRANAPGKMWGGRPAPETTGADGIYRFEIDDSKAIFLPGHIDRVANKKQVGDKTTTIGDILVHDELFYQYPQLKDIKVIVDESLANTSTAGYFSPADNLIAFSPGRLNNLEDMKKTLIHELQHGVQEIEGFARGDNITSSNVSAVASAIREKRKKDVLKYLEIKKQRDAQFNKKVNAEFLEDKTRPLVSFYAELLEEGKGIPFTDSILSTSNRINPAVGRASANPYWSVAYELDTEVKRLNEGFRPDIWTGQRPKRLIGPSGDTFSTDVKAKDQVAALATSYHRAYTLAKDLKKRGLVF